MRINPKLNILVEAKGEDNSKIKPLMYITHLRYTDCSLRLRLKVLKSETPAFGQTLNVFKIDYRLDCDNK